MSRTPSGASSTPGVSFASERGACLEIGANPYFTTLLLDEHTDLKLTLTNYYGETASATTTETLRYRGADGAQVEKAFTSHLVNVEREPFPFEDDAFDVVLLCEVIEHLLMDPLAALREINRVLRPGGPTGTHHAQREPARQRAEHDCRLEHL